MPFYVFRLHEINPKVTRSVAGDGRKSSDDDVVVFIVRVNESERAHGVSTFQPVFSGGPLPANIFPPNHAVGLSRGWRTGPMEIAPNDGVTVVYSGTNIGDKEIDINAERQAEIEIKILDTIVSAVVGAIGGAVGA